MQFQLEGIQALTPALQKPAGAAGARMVGQLRMTETGDGTSALAVSRFHFDGDNVRYQLRADAANGPWLEHQESMEYVPYAFTVMNALTRLPQCWDKHLVLASGRWCRLLNGVDASLKVTDSRVLADQSLWLEVRSVHSLEVTHLDASGHLSAGTSAARLRGWIPSTGLRGDPMACVAGVPATSAVARVAGSRTSCQTAAVA